MKVQTTRQKALNYLCHHGVQGQKWGVRHGPPYPIEDKVLRSGHKVSSVSVTKKTDKYKNSGKMIYTWDSNDEHDAQIYRGPFTNYLRSRYAYKLPDFNNPKASIVIAPSKIFEHQFEVLKDLKMPSSKQRIDEFVKLYNSSTGKQRQRFTDELNEECMRLLKRHSYKGLENYNLIKKFERPSMLSLKGLQGEQLTYVSNLNAKLSNESAKSAYAVFNHLMEDSHGYEITRQYVANLKKKWDAMVDDNNVNIYNEAHDPIMFFNPKEDLKSITRTGRVVTKEEQDRNEDAVADRRGGRVML